MIQLWYPFQGTSSVVVSSWALGGLPAGQPLKRNGDRAGGCQWSQERGMNHTTALQVQTVLMAPHWERFCQAHLGWLLFCALDVGFVSTILDSSQYSLILSPLWPSHFILCSSNICLNPLHFHLAVPQTPTPLSLSVLPVLSLVWSGRTAGFPAPPLPLHLTVTWGKSDGRWSDLLRASGGRTGDPVFLAAMELAQCWVFVSINWCRFYRWHCTFALCDISLTGGVVSFAYNTWFWVLLPYQVCVQRAGKGSRVSRMEMEQAGMQGGTRGTKRSSGKLLQLSSAFRDSRCNTSVPRGLVLGDTSVMLTLDPAQVETAGSDPSSWAFCSKT